MSDSMNLKMTFVPVPVAPAPTQLGTASPKSIDDVASFISNRFGASAVKAIEKAHKGDPFVVVDSSKLAEVVKALRDDEKFLCTMLQVVSATDFLPVAAQAATETSSAVAPSAGRIEVLYALWSFQHRHQVLIKVNLDRDNPRVKTLSEVYRAANWYERECYDMLGVIFEGHPDLQRILLPPDWVGHPLRRDYIFPEEYNGMKVPL